MENVLWAIFGTFVYTIVSSAMAFKMMDIFEDHIDVTELSKHFLIWPIELLFIVILGVRYAIEERYGIELFKIKK